MPESTSLEDKKPAKKPISKLSDRDILKAGLIAGSLACGTFHYVVGGTVAYVAYADVAEVVASTTTGMFNSVPRLTSIFSDEELDVELEVLAKVSWKEASRRIRDTRVGLLPYKARFERNRLGRRPTPDEVLTPHPEF